MKRLKVLKINLLVICMFVLFSLFTTGEAIATTYYVSPTGNDSNSGLNGAPFKTIQRAANIVNPGDTVIVKNGVYTVLSGSYIIDINRAGTVSNPITFRAETKWGAVLDGQDVGEGIITRIYSSNIRIEDFEIQNTKEIGIMAQGNNTYIKGNKIHDVGRHETYTLYGLSGIYTSLMSGLTIDSNIFYNIGRLNPYTTPSATQASCTYPANGSIVCYNHDHTIYLDSDNVIIINNIFYDNKSGWQVQISPAVNTVTVINNTF